MLETSPHGIAFRLGDITMEQFWEEAQRLAGVSGKDPRALMDNWARSYAIYHLHYALINEYFFVLVDLRLAVRR